MNKLSEVRMTRKLVPRFSLVIAVVLALLVALYGFPIRYVPTVASSPQIVIRINYVLTSVKKALGEAPTTLETGSVYVAPDGRVRKETIRIIQGEQRRTVQLVDFRQKVLFVLDSDRKIATQRSLTGEAPSVPRGPGGFVVSDNLTADLGVKTINQFTLRGFRQTMNLKTPAKTMMVAHETWIYNVGVSPTSVLVLEHRYESDQTIEDQRVTDVSTTSVPQDFFLVPPDFLVVPK